VEASWLASRLEEGRSIESIAREAGCSASTVAYWVNKHGLTSKHAPKHAARGGIARDELEALVALGMPIRKMAEASRFRCRLLAPRLRSACCSAQPATRRSRQASSGYPFGR
jgi:transposase-like protein